MAPQFLVTVVNSKTGSTSQHELAPTPGNPAVPTFRIGSSKECELVLEGLSAQHALVARQGPRNLVTSHANASVVVRKVPLQPGTPTIVNAEPFAVGPYTLTIRYE